MWTQGSEITAVIVAFCAVIAPGAFIAFMLAVLLGGEAAARAALGRRAAALATLVQPWSMNEVMMLGILVALIKIAQLATVIPGIGMYAVGLLVVLLGGHRVDLRSPRDLEPGRVGRRDAAAGSSTAPCRDGRPRARCRVGCRASGARFVRDLRAAVAARPGRSSSDIARAAAATLAKRHHFSIQYHVGAGDRRGDLLHPGQRVAGAHDDHARVDGADTIIGGVVFLYTSGRGRWR